EFVNARLFKAGETVDTASVWLGDKADVPLVIEDKLILTMPRKARRDMKVRLVYDGPIPAPVRKGQVVGFVEVSAPDVPKVEVPVVAGADVARLGLPNRIFAAINYLIYGPKKIEGAKTPDKLQRGAPKLKAEG
ncbi:MAG: hypothetical protein FJX42_08515, partial [Alphaproteobacteria bacterium]|nr:hypothetical protein [Alphaproteobacteria bacterium]